MIIKIEFRNLICRLNSGNQWQGGISIPFPVLSNLRLLEEIDADTFAAKSRELRDEAATLRLEMERCDRGRDETIDIAVKAFELSQTLRGKWLTADYAAKRRILEIVCLNCTLDDVNLCAKMSKPFDLLAKGLVSKDSRGDKTRLELFVTALSDLQTSEPVAFAGLKALIGVDRKQLK